MELELRHLRSFVAVAEERHFGRAAERLHMAQPPLSQQIRKLEEELGMELFDRSTRPVRVTPAGTHFLEEAYRTLEQARRAVERGRRAARGELGHLSIGAMPRAYNRLVPSVVALFRARVRHVTLELSMDDPTALADAVRDEQLDAAFSGPPIETRGLSVELIESDPMVAIVPKAHPLAERAGVSLADLAGETFISVSREVSQGIADMERSMFATRALTRAEVIEAPSTEAQLALVAAGVGVGLLLDSYRHLCNGAVSFVPLQGGAPSPALVLLSRHDDGREVVRTFLDTAREVAGSSQPKPA